MINLDFDADGRLIGIEVLDASKFLPLELLVKPNDSVAAKFFWMVKRGEAEVVELSPLLTLQ